MATLGLGMYLAKMHNVPGVTDAQKSIMRAREAFSLVLTVLLMGVGVLTLKTVD